MSTFQNTDIPTVPNTNEGPWALGVVLTIRSLAVIIVALRLYTRIIAKHTAGWDDAAITVSALLTIVGGAGDIVRVSHGWGRHAQYIQPYSNLVLVLKWATIGQLLNFISLFFMRMSICFFTLRFLPMTLKWPQRVTYGALLLNLISTIANCIIFTTVCIPIHALWDRNVPGHCLRPQQLAGAFGGASALGVIVDFVIVIVPLLTIRHIQLNRRTKIGISIIMSLGFLTASCTIGKMVVDHDVNNDPQKQIPVFLFSIFEECCGIICASMPAMRQLYKCLLKKDVVAAAQSPTGYCYGGSGRSERSDPMRSPLVSGGRVEKEKISSPLATATKGGTSVEMMEMKRFGADVERG